MDFKDLKQKIENHTGVFECVPRGDEPGRKEFTFEHIIEVPSEIKNIPDVGGLREFYLTFGSLRLYLHSPSGDSAYYIARTEEWDVLSGHFQNWCHMLEEEERNELIPAWVDTAVAVGEIPSSGNYLLVATKGSESGCIYEFEHDGFEFLKLSKNIAEFLQMALAPTSRTLTNMASHMTFIQNDPMEQWWIKEMRDNKGHVVQSEA